MPLKLADTKYSEESQMAPAADTKVPQGAGRMVGSITIVLWENAKPTYQFKGGIVGKHLQIATHHLRKAYSLFKRGVRRGEEA